MAVGTPINAATRVDPSLDRRIAAVERPMMPNRSHIQAIWVSDSDVAQLARAIQMKPTKTTVAVARSVVIDRSMVEL